MNSNSYSDISQQVTADLIKKLEFARAEIGQLKKEQVELISLIYTQQEQLALFKSASEKS